MYRRHLLGTDFHGYYMLTRILHGFRYTVGAVVVLAGGRIVLSLCLGMLVWFRRSGRKRAPPRTPINVPGFIVVYFSRTNELAGMVGEYRTYLTSDQWLLLAPLWEYLSVLLALFGLSRIVKGMTRFHRGTSV